MRVSITGAAPAATARSSIAGAIASMTHSTSLDGLELTGVDPSAPQDAQARVLLLAPAATVPGEPCERRDEDIAEGVQQRDERRCQQRGGVQIEAQRLPGGAVGQPDPGA